MTRLTPEREDKIRSCTCNWMIYAEEIIPELLSEIDALRADKQELMLGWTACADKGALLLKERDQFKAENDGLICEKRGIEAAMKAVLDENQKLKAENEKLLHAECLCPACGTEWTLSQPVDCKIVICQENQKLRERIVKLREGLAAVKECGMKAHADGTSMSHSLQLGIATGTAVKYLAQDDEEGKS